MNDISPAVKEKAPLILAEIRKAKHILLHCHPSPDPDSVGSALAMKFAVEQLGKKATVIKGDSDIPQAFMHFPGAKEIAMKSWWEIDHKEFDLFIIVDASLSGVSRSDPATIPPHMKVINIDHHRTNEGCGSINLIEPSYPANAQLLFDLFKEMDIKLTVEIASNLFMGIFGDTGGFKYAGTTARSLLIGSELVAIVPHFSRLVADMENSGTLSSLTFQGIALSSMKTILDGKAALSVVSYEQIQERSIPDISISAGTISSIMRRMGEFHIVGAVIEARPGKVKLSFRSHDSDTHDVSKLAVSLGGGGHKGAAGVAIDGTLEEVQEKIANNMKELYNF